MTTDNWTPPNQRGHQPRRKAAMPELRRPPPMQREVVAPAPELTTAGRCSQCGVPPVAAGGGDLKVCPRCFALLWRRDHAAEERQRKQEAAEAALQAAARAGTTGPA